MRHFQNREVRLPIVQQVLFLKPLDQIIAPCITGEKHRRPLAAHHRRDR